MPKKKRVQNPEEMPRLQILREAVGLSQTDLARKIPDMTGTKSLNQSAISRWESGEDKPKLTISQTKALCRALGVTLDQLPDDFGPPKRSEAHSQ
ncbi:MAG: helix-turn-helix transcriptional regulator [Tolypothrix carrinoi HA7290-LM1]|jgi:transcriptional regulator with XRE-family HTH domain|nr:helix-turn-helix transcriptional regulator [Tolypothrix carrinoi HA7290-LM1]